MTISRDDVASYLATQFSSLAAAVAQDAAPLTGYAPDIDSALRKLGTIESALATATVENANRDKLFTLAEYFAARRFWRLLSDRINFTADGASFNHQYMLTNAKALADDAAKQLILLGIDVSGDGWGVSYLNLDWLEPA